MSNETLFYISLIRLISYTVVLSMSTLSLIKKRNNRIIWIGDIIFVSMSLISFVMTQFHGLNLSFGTAYIFTPAFFIWALTRVADYFSVNNYLNKNGQTNSQRS